MRQPPRLGPRTVECTATAQYGPDRGPRRTSSCSCSRVTGWWSTAGRDDIAPPAGSARGTTRGSVVGRRAAGDAQRTQSGGELLARQPCEVAAARTSDVVRIGLEDRVHPVDLVADVRVVLRRATPRDLDVLAGEDADSDGEVLHDA